MWCTIPIFVPQNFCTSIWKGHWKNLISLIHCHFNKYRAHVITVLIIWFLFLQCSLCIDRIELSLIPCSKSSIFKNTHFNLKMPLVNEIWSYYIIWMFYPYSDVPVIVISNYSRDLLTLEYLTEWKSGGDCCPWCVCKDLQRDSFFNFCFCGFVTSLWGWREQQENCSNHSSKEFVGIGLTPLRGWGMPHKSS